MTFLELCQKLNATPIKGTAEKMYDMPNWTLSVIRERLGQPESINLSTDGGANKFTYQVDEGLASIFVVMQGEKFVSANIILSTNPGNA